MKLVFIIFASALALSSEDKPLAKQDFKAWLRSPVAVFGCFLEKSFSYKDSKFNCSLKNYKNNGDPCKNTLVFYEGPLFPKNKVKEVHPLIEYISLAWEHGNLQNITVTLSKTIDPKEVKRIFNLPETTSIQACGEKKTCMVLIGFDHMGAGDVDCGIDP